VFSEYQVRVHAGGFKLRSCRKGDLTTQLASQVSYVWVSTGLATTIFTIYYYIFWIVHTGAVREWEFACVRVQWESAEWRVNVLNNLNSAHGGYERIGELTAMIHLPVVWEWMYCIIWTGHTWGRAVRGWEKELICYDSFACCVRVQWESVEWIQ